MAASIFAIVPAAGSSRRMKSATPKLLMQLGGEAVIVRTLKTILSLEDLKRVVVPVSAENEVAFREILQPLSEKVSIIIGGASRTESVRKGLMEVSKYAKSDDIVIIHDGARCFASGELFQNCVDAAKQFGAVTAAIPAVDTMKIAKAGIIAGDVERENLWSIQTPQVFKFEILNKAHESGVEATDDATLVENFHPVRIVEGSRLNFKLTTSDDFVLAEGIVGR